MGERVVGGVPTRVKRCCASVDGWLFARACKRVTVVKVGMLATRGCCCLWSRSTRMAAHQTV